MNIQNNCSIANILGLLLLFTFHPLQGQDLPQDSIYQLEGVWEDQLGNKRTLAGFRNKKQIVSFIYTHCLHTCPTIVSTMQAIEHKLSQAEKQEVGFILVSLTPNSDTPKVLKAFAKKRQLNPENWKLLTGSEEDVHTLAMVLGLKYQKLDNNEVNHANLMTGLDKQGRIMFQETAILDNAQQAYEALKK